MDAEIVSEPLEGKIAIHIPEAVVPEEESAEGETKTPPKDLQAAEESPRPANI